MKTNKCRLERFVFLILLLFPFTLVAQRNTRDYTWPDKGIYESVPDTFLRQDIIILNKEVVFSVVMNPNGEGRDIYSEFFTRLKIKILTIAGLEQNTRFTIRTYAGGEIKTLDARTLKSNGMAVDLFSKDIHELKLTEKAGKQQADQQLRFAIPGAQVGDEVELVILEKVKGIHTADEVFLNDGNAFCLKSAYTIMLPLSFRTDAKCYNQMPRPQIDTLHQQRSIRFSLTNLPPLHEEAYSIPQQEFPFLRFAIRFVPVSYYNPEQNYSYQYELEPNNWLSYGKELLENQFNSSDFLKTRMQKDFANLYDDYFTFSRVNDTLTRIIRFFNYIADHMQVIDVPASEFENSADYYLKKNQVIQPLMIHFFDRMFDKIGLNYFLGLGKNKYTGPFDPDFIASNLATHQFIGFELNSHFYYFFLPTSKRIYEFGEVPISLRGTDAILISKRGNASPVQKFTFPVSDKSQNFTRTKTVLQINLHSGNISRSDRQVLSGNYSTDNRFSLQKDYKEDNRLATEITRKQRTDGTGYELDSVKAEASERVSPFQFALQTNFHQKNAVHAVEKGVYSISLNGVISHDQLTYTPSPRKTAYFTPYLYNDNVKVYLVFSQRVELLNAEELKNSWTGKSGNYTLKAIQVNETTILVESDYDILAPALLPSDYIQIGKMQDETAKSASLQVVVRLKE
jgi:hypothetical protein